MSKPQSIEELFRSRLGEAEITPSEGAWKGVQRKLRMKKFLRFDAGRFNIWYAGALLLAGAAAVALLSRAPAEDPALPENVPPVIEESSEINKEYSGGEETREEKRRRLVSGRAQERENKQAKKEAAVQEDGKRSDPGSAKNARADGIAEGIDVPEAAPENKTEAAESPISYHAPLAHFTASETMGCAPLRVKFRNASVYASAFSWNFGNGTFAGGSDPLYTFEEAGIYAVALTATGEAGDSSVYYEVIRVYPAPAAGFEMGEGLEQPDGSVSVELMNYSTGAYSYSWDILSEAGTRAGDWSSNAFQPTFTSSEIPEAADQVRLVALNEHGCTDTAYAEITELGGVQRTITFPTVFSGNPTGPNGGYYTPNDLRLDIFHPHFSEQPAEYLLRVYSKMGEVIFETRDILQGWDGYYMQSAAAGGVYLWVASGTWHNGSTFSLKGDVTLLWNSR